VPDVFKDKRGFFLESYHERHFRAHGINVNFVQENHSRSLKKGVLRGLHFQKPPYTQAKLVRVSRGSVYDVFVDLRQNSRTFGKWGSIILSDKNFYILFVPEGFAHGFCAMEDKTDFLYKVSNDYMPKSETGVVWRDPTLKIKWPIPDKDLIISDKDKKLPKFKNLTAL